MVMGTYSTTHKTAGGGQSCGHIWQSWRRLTSHPWVITESSKFATDHNKELAAKGSDILGHERLHQQVSDSIWFYQPIHSPSPRPCQTLAITVCWC